MHIQIKKKFKKLKIISQKIKDHNLKNKTYYYKIAQR